MTALEESIAHLLGKRIAMAGLIASIICEDCVT